MTNTQKSLISGVTILSVVGIICKLIGVFFRVPLVWLIGKDGAGMYQLVFPTYNLLLTVSSAGIPVAISRMVSAALAKDDPRGAKQVFRCAVYMLSVIGLVMTLAMVVLSPWLSEAFVNDPETRLGFMAIAPSVFLVCVLSAYRGFMQGQQNMMPTAISQLIEQVLKVAIALPLAFLGSRISLAHAAAGALLGTSLTEALTLLYMILLKKRKAAAFSARTQNDLLERKSGKHIAKQLFLTAIPITLSACIVPLAGVVDSSMIMERLQTAGFTLSQARVLYGSYSACVINLINVPTALALAISMSLVPAISAAMARGDMKGVQRQAILGLRFSFLIGLPCSLGMSILAEPILRFVYGATLTGQDLKTAAELLSVSSLTIILFTVVQSTSGILQGLKKQKIPMYSLMAGVACKIALNAILIPMPEWNIHGAPVSSIVCYAVSAVPNLYYVLKHTNMKFDWMGILVRPLLATLVMGAAVLLLDKVLPGGIIMLIIKLLAGIASFAGAAIAFKAITKEDLSLVKRR